MGMCGWNEKGCIIKGHFCIFSESFTIGPGEELNQLKFDNKVFFLDLSDSVAAEIPDEATEKALVPGSPVVSAAENRV